MKSLREFVQNVQTMRRAPQERFSQEATFEPDIEDTAGELTVPAPASPVPISYPTPRESPPKNERFFMTLGSTTDASGTLGNLEKMTEFGINSIKVDNLTPQWVYLPDVDNFVPPQTWNAVVRGNGSTVFRARYETPPSVTAAAAATSTARTMFYVTAEIIPIASGAGAKTS